MKPLAIEQVDHAAKVCIRHFEHWPKPANLYQLAEEDAKPAPYTPTIQPPQSFGLRLVNHMFLAYLVQRRTEERFLGDMDIPARRQACLSLAQWIDDMKAEGMLPALDQCKSAFKNAMERIPDAASLEEVF